MNDKVETRTKGETNLAYILGNCSVISKSTAIAYANKLFKPKPVERKF